MNKFQRLEKTVVAGMLQRCMLMQQPCEFFAGFFNGRVPTVQEKLRFIEEALIHLDAAVTYHNDEYTVAVSQRPPFYHLDIRRNDGGPVRSWRDLQQIKNELVGTAHEAVELYPSENRLVDTANQYHLWVAMDPNYRFPFGFNQRAVLDQPMRVSTDADGKFSFERGQIRPPLDSMGGRSAAEPAFAVGANLSGRD